MVLVDSSAWIDALRRDGDIHTKLAIQGLLDEYEALLCAPVRLEVLGGARKEERRRLNEYLSILPYASMEEELWQQAIENAWRLRDQGITTPWNDILIATLAIEHEVRVYSLDKHFEMMQPALSLTLYEPGYGGKFNADGPV